MLDATDKTGTNKIGHTADIPELARNTPPVNLLNEGEPIHMMMAAPLSIANNDPAVAKIIAEIEELLQPRPYLESERQRALRAERIGDLHRELARIERAEDGDEESEPVSDFNARVLEKMSADTGRPTDEILSELLPGLGTTESTATRVLGIEDLDTDTTRRLQMLANQSGRPVMVLVNPNRYADEIGALADQGVEATPENVEHFASAKPPGWKDNNPKDGIGALKAGVMSYCYGPVILEMAVGMAAGAFKYGAHNYLAVAPRASVYTDAAMRHIMQFTGGEDLDSESKIGVHHITAAMNSLHVLRAAMINGGWVDDRPPAMPDDFMERVNGQMKELAAITDAPVARYFANGQRGPGRIL